MASQFEGFVDIHSIFYSTFHPTEGSKVKFDFPPRSLENSGINFDSIKNYVIPKRALCHRLITFKYGNYRIACYPVTVNSSIYARNFFSFNFVFVFPFNCETSPYEPAIERLGKMFRVLEIQNQILSKSENDTIMFNLKSADKNFNIDNDGSNYILGDDISSIMTTQQKDKYERLNNIISNIKKKPSNFTISDLLMRLYQDLNTYSECLIPIDDGNAVDIKLFPLLTPPTPYISIEHVPISLVNLFKIVDVNWDPIMLTIIPYINGINNIYRISQLSHNEESLVIECIRHLVYYRCIVLTDIFEFSNVYAPTSSLRLFLLDPNMATECQSYVMLPINSKMNDLSLYSNHGKHSAFNGDTGSRNNSVSTSLYSFNGNDSRPQSRSSSVDQSQTNFYKNKKQSESSISTGNSNNGQNIHKHLPTRSLLFDLYRSLSQGITLKEWYMQNHKIIRDNRIDVRRFITFGVLRRIIYRCETYPVINSTDHLQNLWKLNELENPISMENISKLQSNHIDSLAADEALMNAYKKLSLKVPSKGALKSHNTSHSSFSLTPTAPEMENSQAKRNKRLSKVSFEALPEDRNGFRWGSNIKTPIQETTWKKLSKMQRRIMLKALADAETLDKICVLLEMPRQNVVNILHELGELKLINC
ncbi:Nitrogen permease regulator 2 [Nakaseomyces glabratus]|uniref:Nitrogen permease regulator 2 n=1 Tax=Candida glabrata TaxID=5478 RepID=A0A0W0E4B8_CANGB|nr:Nitrogen permease regulator 2 [Nakaseomyces glabratus]KAH7594304.1 Nitrogen permease regulator 2 [Nakaseomyces glabratus]KAH7611492.1 Nitrogen permease regulator 2 [Nakaseomyces glabratus]KAI8393227.1 Nitrogen permease regulator 2 [Nakaseomyces glabratus]KTA99287.1 Nitrogen permease regulator 2 [Nakaseomyces glabratus]